MPAVRMPSSSMSQASISLARFFCINWLEEGGGANLVAGLDVAAVVFVPTIADQSGVAAFTSGAVIVGADTSTASVSSSAPCSSAAAMSSQEDATDAASQSIQESVSSAGRQTAGSAGQSWQGVAPTATKFSAGVETAAAGAVQRSELQ